MLRFVVFGLGREMGVVLELLMTLLTILNGPLIGVDVLFVKCGCVEVETCGVLKAGGVVGILVFLSNGISPGGMTMEYQDFNSSIC